MSAAAGALRRRTALAGLISPIWIVLVAVIVVAALMSDRFLSPYNVVAVLQQGVITGIVALGMTVVLIGGQFDLSTGAVVMMAAVMALLLDPSGPVRRRLAFVLPLLAGTVVGTINGLAVYGAGANSIVATIGMQFLVIGGVLATVSGQHVRADDISAVFSGLALARPLGVPLPVFLFAGLVAVLAVMMSNTVFGRHVYAIGGDIEAARRAGVRVVRTGVATFAISGALAALSGRDHRRAGRPCRSDRHRPLRVPGAHRGGPRWHQPHRRHRPPGRHRGGDPGDRRDHQRHDHPRLPVSDPASRPGDRPHRRRRLLFVAKGGRLTAWQPPFRRWSSGCSSSRRWCRCSSSRASSTASGPWAISAPSPRSISTDGIVVVGMTIVMIAGGFDLSVGAVMAMGGVAAVVLLPYGIVAAALGAIVAGGLAGLLSGALVTRLSINPFIATLAVMVMVRGATLAYTDTRPVVSLDDTFLALGGGRPIPYAFIVLLVGDGDSPMCC